MLVSCKVIHGQSKLSNWSYAIWPSPGMSRHMILAAKKFSPAGTKAARAGCAPPAPFCPTGRHLGSAPLWGAFSLAASLGLMLRVRARLARPVLVWRTTPPPHAQGELCRCAPLPHQRGPRWLTPTAERRFRMNVMRNSRPQSWAETGIPPPARARPAARPLHPHL
jgi:hypothetical protein